MKIVICTNHYLPQLGGSEFVVKHITEHLLNCGHQVEIVTRKNKSRIKSQYNYKIHEYTPGDTPLFNRIIKNIKPDIVFVYSDVFDFFNFLLIDPPSYKLIVAPCGGNWANDNRSHTNIYDRNVAKIARIICHSTRDRDYRHCEYLKLLGKTVIIPNGVDLSEFADTGSHREQFLPQHTGKSWIINVGNFFPGKGQHLIFDILDRLSNPEKITYIQVCSTIEYTVGTSLENQWRELSKHNHKYQSFLFKDIPRLELIKLLQSSNVFVCPSQKEVAPLVLLEAMACAVPWVAADVGNTRDLMGGKYIATAKDRTGTSVFDDRVLNLFAKHISDYLIDQSDGQNGKKQIAEQLNWQTILPQYEAVFKEVLSA